MLKDTEILSLFLLAILVKRAPPEGFAFDEEEINDLDCDKRIAVVDNAKTGKITVRLATGEEKIMSVAGVRWMKTL
jgi:hypothetical protein